MLRAAFRVEAGPAVGLGHLMRCLALADALSRDGVRSAFLMSDASRDSWHHVNGHGHFVTREFSARVRCVPAGRLMTGQEIAHDAEAVVQALNGSHPYDLLVFDHYSLDSRWVSACRSAARTVCAIDDLANRPLGCDVLIDQNLREDGGAGYDLLVESDCVRLIGPKFALLRPEFAEAVDSGIAPLMERPARVTLALGGSRQTELLDRLLPAVVNAAERRRWSVRVWGACSVPSSRAGVEVVPFVHDVPRALLDCRLVVGAAGSSSWERCCLGVPTLSIVIADNQRGVARALDAEGAACYFGDTSALRFGDLEVALGDLLDATERMQHMSAAGMRLVDGRGARRVAAALRSAI